MVTTGSMARTVHLQSGSDACTIEVEGHDGRFTVRAGERSFTIGVHAGEQGRLDLEVDGRRLRVYIARQGNQIFVAFDGVTWQLHKPEPKRRGPATAEPGGSLHAAMPGRVLDVLVIPGAPVKRGDTLVLLEAMKMELRIQAPADGQVVRVLVQAGAVVERGQVLVEVS